MYGSMDAVKEVEVASYTRGVACAKGHQTTNVTWRHVLVATAHTCVLSSQQRAYRKNELY